jgi:hypothetical protein
MSNQLIMVVALKQQLCSLKDLDGGIGLNAQELRELRTVKR